MSYILTATSTPLATPISILNGGTGSTTASGAIENLTSADFLVSASSTSWGQISVASPTPPFSTDDNGSVLTDLIDALAALGVIL